jgi:adenine deaminase
MTQAAPKAPLADRIDQGRGIVPADLVLKGGGSST